MNNESERLEPIAAEEHSGGAECEYGCGDLADWEVEVRNRATDERTTFYCCQACSRENRVYAKENDLHKHDISEEARA